MNWDEAEALARIEAEEDYHRAMRYRLKVEDAPAHRTMAYDIGSDRDGRVLVATHAGLHLGGEELHPDDVATYFWPAFEDCCSAVFTKNHWVSALSRVSNTRIHLIKRARKTGGCLDPTLVAWMIWASAQPSPRILGNLLQCHAESWPEEDRQHALLISRVMFEAIRPIGD